MSSRGTVRELSRLFDHVTTLNLALGLSGVTLCAILIGTCAAFRTSGPLPPPGDPPPTTDDESAEANAYRYKSTFYRSILDQDAAKLHLKRVSLPDMMAPNPYALELKGPQRLRVGGRINTESLRLRLIIKKIWSGSEGSGIHASHLVLQIANRTDRSLAYRVETESPGDCGHMGIIPHNAIALEAKGQLERSECPARTTESILIKRVEVLQLSAPIMYHYVSRLDPFRLRFDERTSEGHSYDQMATCGMLPWRLISDALAQGQASWRDLLDFYARHNCDDYPFFVGYRWSAQGQPRVPARPR